MSIYPPPSQTGLIFDLDNWEQILDTVGGIPTSFLNENYLQYTTAQGDETFSNTINTGYSDVDGSTICNTFDTYSTPAITSLFDTTDNASQVIRLGIGQTSGTINLGKQYDELDTYGTNQVANWTSKGLLVGGDTASELNLTDATSNSYIGHNQTTGELYLGTNASRGGTILFGSDASDAVSHNIGSSTSTVRLAGDVTIINTTTKLSQTTGSVYMTTENYTITYSEVVNELYIVNANTSLKSLYLPSTIRDFTFWVTTLSRALIIRRGGTLLIDFLCDATTALTINPYSTVCIVACVGTNSFNLIYSSDQMYQPMRLYPNLTSFAPTSIQSGYVFYTAGVNVVKASGATTATSLNLTATALPLGVYYINVYGYITITAVGVAPLLQLKKPFFVGCVSTTLDQSTVVNNIADSYFNTSFYTPVNGAVFAQLGVGGYYNNSTAGTILYGYGRIDAGTVNVNTAYRVNLEMNIRRIC